MRLSNERISELKKLLKEQFGLNYSDEEAQEAGVAIIRFMIAKQLRNQELKTSKGIRNGKNSNNNT